ncbi:MAG: M23 family metallopeptidase, partial [Myxococcota bacterium]|nr:M23 family metallopeptidase [Myxococcota bacterium]
GTSQRLGPKGAKAFPRNKIGAGGLMVTLKHDKGLTSAYMHLDDFTVENRQKVRRGDLIGHVGRTGIRQSSAHLHFEMRCDGKHIDPARYLGKTVFPATATYRGLRLKWEEARKRRARRRKR